MAMALSPISNPGRTAKSSLHICRHTILDKVPLEVEDEEEKVQCHVMNEITMHNDTQAAVPVFT